MSRLPNFGGIFDLARMTSELEELEAKMGQPDFWNDARAAAGVSRKKVKLERDLQQWRWRIVNGPLPAPRATGMDFPATGTADRAGSAPPGGAGGQKKSCRPKAARL